MLVQSLREHVKHMMDENRHEAAAAVAGKEWMRGWDDWKKEGPAPGPAVATSTGAVSASTSTNTST